MICGACKKQKHERCPNNVENWRTDSKQQHPTGLSPEGDAIQRSGLCPCRHRVSK